MTTMAINTLEDQETKERSERFLLGISIGSMLMLFAGLTSALIVRKAEGNWIDFNLPTKFYISTALLLFGSVSMNWALSSAKKDNKKNILNALLITLFLALGFIYYQFAAWGELVANNIYFTGPDSHSSGSYLYVLTGLHFIHLLGGLFGLTIVLVKSFRNKYGINNHNGIKLMAIYWHFLDFLWIYLFMFLLFIG